MIPALQRAGLLSPRVALALARGVAAEGGNPAALLAARAHLHPERIAVDDGEQRLTYPQLLATVRAAAAGLTRDHAAGPGRRIALLARDGVPLVIGLFAAARTGADVVLLHPDWTPQQRATLAGRTRIDLLLHEADLVPGMAVPALPLDALPSGDVLPRRKGGGLAVLTGGTTGQAKLARRRPSPLAFARLFAGLIAALDLGRHRAGLIATPLHHGFGLAALLTAVALGQAVHLRRRLDPAELPGLIAGGVSAVTLVPTQLRRLLDAQALAGIGLIVAGGAPLPTPLGNAALARLGPVLHDLYGTSEAGVATHAGPADLREAPGSVGRPFPGVRLRLDGQTNGTGRVLVRSPAAVAGGWQDTGDLGFLDAAGRLHLRGRADEMIVSGGENVYPADVAAVLAGHPHVTAAAAVGVPEPDWGQRLVVFVEASVPAEALTAWLAGEVARHQRPRAILLLDALPLTPIGKVDRQALRRLATNVVMH